MRLSRNETLATLAFAIASLLGLAFVTKGRQALDSQQKTYDDLLVRVSERVPGFGGMFVDSDGRLAVYLLDPAQLPAARSAIEAVFGPSSVPPAGVRALRGQYSISQLKQWFDYANALLEMPGVAMVDLDDGKNRLMVGVEDASQVRQVEQGLGMLGVPRESVNIEVTGPIVRGGVPK
jgi:hypothetical protein